MKIHSGLIFFVGIIFISSILYTTYAETELKTCKERGMEFSTDKDNVQGYELIHMISHENHTEDIKLTLCWIVDNQVQVGKLITLDATASSERYTMNNINHTITITFPNEIINYWEDSNHTRQFNYTTSNQLILTQNNFGIFESEPINFRFTVPENISITYCEYFPNEECFEVSNLLRPASYYLDQEIELAGQTIKLANETLFLTKETLILTKEILVLTEKTVNLNEKITNLTCIIVELTIMIIIVTIIGIIVNTKRDNTKDRHDKKRHIAKMILIFMLYMIPFLIMYLHVYNIPQYCGQWI